jgi:GGDEF domain-containing protein
MAFRQLKMEGVHRGNFRMQLFDKVSPTHLDRREMQLTLFACLAISILAVGMAVLMYPLVFSSRASVPEWKLHIAFFGFCVLSLLLAGYLWDRQSTIRRLRQEVAESHRRTIEAQALASQELLKTMPHFNSFQDRLPMEYRRTLAMSHKLSVLVANVELSNDDPASMTGTTLLGDAAKAISRKLRQQDSIYLLGPTCFGAVLPGTDIANAQRIADRVAEGLADAAGVSNRFMYRIKVINYPTHAASAHELQQAVRALIPGGTSMRTLASEALS